MPEKVRKKYLNFYNFFNLSFEKVMADLSRKSLFPWPLGTKMYFHTRQTQVVSLRLLCAL